MTNFQSQSLSCSVASDEDDTCKGLERGTTFSDAETKTYTPPVALTLGSSPLSPLPSPARILSGPITPPLKESLAFPQRSPYPLHLPLKEFCYPHHPPSKILSPPIPLQRSPHPRQPPPQGASHPSHPSQTHHLPLKEPLTPPSFPFNVPLSLSHPPPPYRHPPSHTAGYVQMFTRNPFISLSSQNIIA